MTAKVQTGTVPDGGDCRTSSNSKTVTFDQLFASNRSIMDPQAGCRDGSLQA